MTSAMATANNTVAVTSLPTAIRQKPMSEPERFIFLGGHAVNPKAIAAITPTDGVGSCSVILIGGDHLSLKMSQNEVLSRWFEALTGETLDDVLHKSGVTAGKTFVPKGQC